MDDDTRLTVGRVAFGGLAHSALADLNQIKENTRELVDRLHEAHDFLRELALPPYPDSDPASLLAWARARAKAILEKHGERSNG